jgi:hypothetical protein
VSMVMRSPRGPLLGTFHKGGPSDVLGPPLWKFLIKFSLLSLSLSLSCARAAQCYARTRARQTERVRKRWGGEEERGRKGGGEEGEREGTNPADRFTCTNIYIYIYI